MGGAICAGVGDPAPIERARAAIRRRLAVAAPKS
jgi:hypothetical protein